MHTPRKLNRAPERLPANLMLTHQIIAPMQSHFRKATCAEVDCRHHQHGWVLRTAGLDPALVHAARTSGRRYIETADEQGSPILTFEAGQPCFRASEHRKRLDREPVYRKWNGDHRGRTDGLHTAPVSISGPDAFADSLRTQMERTVND